MALTRENFESDEAWEKYQGREARETDALKAAEASGIAREDAFRQKSADYSQVGAAISGAGKAKTRENWAAFSHGALIALDVASLGSLGAARIVGQKLKLMKEGPQDRALTLPEKVQMELQILAVQKADADAKAAQASGNRKAIAETIEKRALEQAKLDAKIGPAQASADARVATAKINSKTQELKIVTQEAVDKIALVEGKINDQEQKIVNEYNSMYSDRDLDTIDYQDAVVEFAEKVKGLEPVAVSNMLDEMGEFGLKIREAADPESGDPVLQKDDSIKILQNQILQAAKDKEILLSEIPALTRKSDALRREIKRTGVGRIPRVIIGADGKEQLVYEDAPSAGTPELDLSYLRDLANSIPDVRPESQKMIEAVRDTEEYSLGMVEVGLNPDNIVHREIYEARSRKAMRTVRRLTKRALRKGVPIEQLPQFQEYLAEVEAGGITSPKFSSMDKQLILMYSGVDIDAITGGSPEPTQSDPGARLREDIGVSSRFANLRGVRTGSGPAVPEEAEAESEPLKPASEEDLAAEWETLTPEQKEDLEYGGTYGGGPEGIRGWGVDAMVPKQKPLFAPEPLYPAEPGHPRGRRPEITFGEEAVAEPRRSLASQLPAGTGIPESFGESSSTEVPASPISDLPYKSLELDRDKIKLMRLIQKIEAEKGPETIPAGVGGGPGPVPY